MDRDHHRRAGRAFGVTSCIFVIAFGIFWCVMAVAIGAAFMLFFGIPFVGLAVARLVFCLRSEKKNRKEPEPWDLPECGTEPSHRPGTEGRFCPYCGRNTGNDYEFCPYCGRRLP